MPSTFVRSTAWPFFRRPASAARVVCGNQPVAATISSSVAPPARWRRASTFPVLLYAFGSVGVMAGAGLLSVPHWAGATFVLGSRAIRRLRGFFLLFVMGWSPDRSSAILLPPVRAPPVEPVRVGSRSCRPRSAQTAMLAWPPKSNGKCDPELDYLNCTTTGSERLPPKRTGHRRDARGAQCAAGFPLNHLVASLPVRERNPP